MKKKIAILGSTGSIGKTLLKVIEKDKKNFEVVLLTANKDYKTLIHQAKKFNVKNLIINNKNNYKLIKKKLKTKINIFNSFNNLEKIINKKIDYTMSSIVGIDGLGPTCEIIKYTKNIAIANKESIICGWNIIKKKLKKHKTNFIPVDSEHFSIWFGLQNINYKLVEKIYLTASGGPFYNLPLNDFKKINVKKAINHPNWRMGKKISIDSATLMNKILELIEAYKLFNIPEDKLDIIIHPDSLIHAIVELNNGLTKFLYHETSMIIPLANAMFQDQINIREFYSYKEKKLKDLHFKSVDPKIFPIIKIKNRINEHHSTPIILNASNEIFVDQFLQKKIPFLSIFKIIMSILNDRNYRKYAIRKPKNIEEIKQIDLWARELTMKKIKRIK